MTWRVSANLDDQGINGEDLTGGYFDGERFETINFSGPDLELHITVFPAGDWVKFNFPQAGALTILAWGAVDYKAAYQAIGQWDYLLQAIKWGTDYFLKCHADTNFIYGQVSVAHIFFEVHAMDRSF